MFFLYPNFVCITCVGMSRKCITLFVPRRRLTHTAHVPAYVMLRVLSHPLPEPEAVASHPAPLCHSTQHRIQTPTLPLVLAMPSSLYFYSLFLGRECVPQVSRVCITYACQFFFAVSRTRVIFYLLSVSRGGCSFSCLAPVWRCRFVILLAA